ncbi:MAG: hypothetical protein RLZZ597_3434 [Cyanobacteriota bacterium]|jgi:hypothetical protein
MNRCVLCGYGITGEWWDEGICDDCHRHREQVAQEWGDDDDFFDYAADAYITQRPGASRGPRAPRYPSTEGENDR